MSNHLVVNPCATHNPRQFETVGLSEREIAELCASIGDIGFWRYDLETGLAYWSEGVFRLHGREFKEGPVSLKAAIGDFHPDDQDVVSQCVSEAIEKQCGYSYTLRLMRDGNPIWVRVHARYHVPEDGRPILYGCISAVSHATRCMEIGSHQG
ncbi:PAS domain-containing protein [Salaquimonas pukyongi]|uniref:PAS domain-containing protein n=1 Tax=Salaquimonas pukyongi TaxID=2712698 RepID=UPI00096B824A|nr:PAS domain-containing protein [Salaquimonas pukyongi]